MTFEVPRRLREDPDESVEFRRALGEYSEDSPSEETLAAIKSGVALRRERGELPRLLADETEASTELHAALLDSAEEFPKAEQLASLRRSLDRRTLRMLPAPRRRSRARLVALGLVFPALAAAAASGYYFAGQVGNVTEPQASPATRGAGAVKQPLRVAEAPVLTSQTEPTVPSSSAVATAMTAKPARSNAPPTKDEYEFIREAQGMRGRSPTESLALLSQHAKFYPRGVLAEERERLAIECLLQMGRSGEARSRAMRFQRSYPGSVHWPALQGLLERQGQVLPPEK